MKWEVKVMCVLCNVDGGRVEMESECLLLLF
jgi:hypothetical protein